MAVETDGSRFAAGAWETLKRGISSIGMSVRVTGDHMTAGMRTWLRRVGLYDFLTYGPLVRFVSKTMQRRIIVANRGARQKFLGAIARQRRLLHQPPRGADGVGGDLAVLGGR